MPSRAAVSQGEFRAPTSGARIVPAISTKSRRFGLRRILPKDDWQLRESPRQIVAGLLEIQHEYGHATYANRSAFPVAVLPDA